MQRASRRSCWPDDMRAFRMPGNSAPGVPPLAMHAFTLSFLPGTPVLLCCRRITADPLTRKIIARLRIIFILYKTLHFFADASLGRASDRQDSAQTSRKRVEPGLTNPAHERASRVEFIRVFTSVLHSGCN